MNKNEQIILQLTNNAITLLVTANTNNGNILNSYVVGDVTAIDENVGGLVGNGDQIYVYNCYAAGLVTGEDVSRHIAGSHLLGTAAFRHIEPHARRVLAEQLEAVGESRFTQVEDGKRHVTGTGALLGHVQVEL